VTVAGGRDPDLALLERPGARDAADAQALFEEARRRRRRRWVTGCLALSLAVVATGVGLASSRGSPPPAASRAGVAPARPSGPTPTVNLRAFQGHGRLAFVSRGRLWVMDGKARTVREVSLPEGLVPLAPTFSPDGRWLAFTTGAAPLMQASLWVAPANGSEAHRVKGIVVGDAFGWSPRADLYAVATGPLSRRAPFGQPTTVRLVSPTGVVRVLAEAPAIVGAAWSPDGSELAVSTMDHDFVSTLSSYVVSTGRRTTWTGASDGRQRFVVPAGWWRSWGVVYTVIGNGSVPDGEGSFEDSSLYADSSPGAKPRFLGQTLTNDSDGAVTGTRSGDIAFVDDSASFPRVPWSGKQVVVCLASTRSCHSVPAPAQNVTEDPAWNPAGTELAYVAAPQLTTSEFLPSVVARWYDAHSLELYDVGAGAAAPGVSAPGATVPLWSAGGSHLLYAAGDGLWLTTSSGSPVEVASPLFAPSSLTTSSSPLSYYGEIDWAQQFGWSAAAGTTAPCYVVCDPSI
jgi:hypothetical protein